MNFLNGTPLVRFLLLLVCGILSAMHFPCIDLQITIFISCGLMAVFFLQFMFRKSIARYQRRWAKGAVSYAAVFFAGYLITMLGNEKNDPGHFRNISGGKFVGIVNEPLSERGNKYRSFIKVLYVYNGEQWLAGKGNCLVYFSGDSAAAALKYGDLIFWDGKPTEVPRPANPSQFNFKAWLELRQVFDQKYFRNNEWRLLGHHYGNELYAFSYSLREKLIGIFSKSGISGQDFAVLAALILGYDDEIDNDVISAYAASGALHVLSVSGLHVGIIFIAISRLLGFLNVNRRTRLIKSVVIILFLWIYALLTGLSPSVLRSATMLSFIIIGRMTRQHISLFNTLAASAFFLLVLNPYMIMQVGFQLSYMAVLGIIFLQPKIETWLDPPGWILRNIWSITSVSIAAQLATAPLGLFYFNQFPVYFILANLIIIPISTIAIYGGILLLMIPWWTVGSAFIGVALGWIVRMMNASAMFIEQLPHSAIGGISITALETCLMYALIISIGIFLVKKDAYILLIGTAGMLLLLTSQLVESILFASQKKMVVYSIRGKSVLNIIDAGKNFLVADSTAASDKRMMSFNIYQYWWQRGLNEKDVHIIKETDGGETEFLYYKGFLQYKDFRIGFVKDNCPVFARDRRPHVDFLIISGNSPRIKCVMERFSFKHLIIDSSVASSKALKMINEARKANLSVYSVLHQGAFVYDLSLK